MDSKCQAASVSSCLNLKCLYLLEEIASTTNNNLMFINKTAHSTVRKYPVNCLNKLYDSRIEIIKNILSMLYDSKNLGMVWVDFWIQLLVQGQSISDGEVFGLHEYVFLQLGPLWFLIQHYSLTTVVETLNWASWKQSPQRLSECNAAN